MFYNSATRRDSNGELVLDVLQRARISKAMTITAREQKQFYDMFAKLEEPMDYLDVACIHGINDKSAYTRMCFFLGNLPPGRELAAAGRVCCDRDEISRAISIIKQFEDYCDDANDLVYPDVTRINKGAPTYNAARVARKLESGLDEVQQYIPGAPPALQEAAAAAKPAHRVHIVKTELGRQDNEHRYMTENLKRQIVERELRTANEAMSDMINRELDRRAQIKGPSVP
jgi:hypothetical protein